MKPLASNVLVKEDEVQEYSKGGILLTEESKEKPTSGTVVGVGRDVTDIAVGQKILYGKYAGTEVDSDGEKLVIMQDVEILGIIEED